MHIEVWKNERDKTGQPWHWHKRNQGRITCDAEAFPTKGNAMRAAKADVRQTIKPFGSRPVMFHAETRPDGGTILTWS